MPRVDPFKETSTTSYALRLRRTRMTSSDCQDDARIRRWRSATTRETPVVTSTMLRVLIAPTARVEPSADQDTEQGSSTMHRASSPRVVLERVSRIQTSFVALVRYASRSPSGDQAIGVP